MHEEEFLFLVGKPQVRRRRSKPLLSLLLVRDPSQFKVLHFCGGISGRGGEGNSIPRSPPPPPPQLFLLPSRDRRLSFGEACIILPLPPFSLRRRNSFPGKREKGLSNFIPFHSVILFRNQLKDLYFPILFSLLSSGFFSRSSPPSPSLHRHLSVIERALGKGERVCYAVRARREGKWGGRIYGLELAASLGGEGGGSDQTRSAAPFVSVKWGRTQEDLLPGQKRGDSLSALVRLFAPLPNCVRPTATSSKAFSSQRHGAGIGLGMMGGNYWIVAPLGGKSTHQKLLVEYENRACRSVK